MDDIQNTKNKSVKTQKVTDSQLNIYILARMSNIWYEENTFWVGGYKYVDMSMKINGFQRL